ncbi:TRAP transporter small permease [Orrella sp. JC864]|uniref:TRAP transporter small permease n=1 Tax=Orrella sp. JC864 TaxID=3120298 RepID=UPI0012BD694F
MPPPPPAQDRAQDTAAPARPEPKVSVPLAIEDVLAVAAMAALALITFANVLVRYFSSRSFAWTEEVSIFLMIVVTMVGACSAFVRNQHIRIEALADGGSDARRRRLAVTSQAVVLAFFVLLAVLSARLVWDEYIYEETSPAIGVPTWWYSIWLPALSAAIALRTLGSLRRLLRARP